jgi:hypothetical protein
MCRRKQFEREAGELRNKSFSILRNMGSSNAGQFRIVKAIAYQIYS